MPTSLFPRARRARAAALLLALPLLAGCAAAATPTHSKASSSTSSSTGSSSFVAKKPCDYLTAAQASAAIGETVKPSERGGACSYDGAHLVSAGITVTGISGADDAIWKDEVKSIKDGDGKSVAIPGVGDEAYGGEIAFVQTMVVRDGDAAIEIATTGGDSKSFTKSIAVAKAIIANLGN